MSILIEKEIKASNIIISEESISIDLNDGRSISAPLSWYPRLFHGTLEERNNWEIIGNGAGIHWPDLDEDLSVESLLAGRPSMENASSLKKWLELRNKT